MHIQRDTILSLLIELLKELEGEEHEPRSRKATPTNLHGRQVMLEAKALVTTLAEKLTLSLPDVVIHALSTRSFRKG